MNIIGIMPDDDDDDNDADDNDADDADDDDDDEKSLPCALTTIQPNDERVGYRLRRRLE
jgi:hypothetical protein